MMAADFVIALGAVSECILLYANWMRFLEVDPFWKQEICQPQRGLTLSTTS